MTEMTDIKGVRRGKCSSCSCSGFKRNEAKVTCLSCGHPPAKHENLDGKSSQVEARVEVKSSSTAVNRLHHDSDEDPDVLCCSYPNCKLSAYFDLNSGESSVYCERHINQPLPQGMHQSVCIRLSVIWEVACTRACT